MTAVLPLKQSSSPVPSPSPSPSTPSFQPSAGLPLETIDWTRPVSELLRTGTKRAHEDVEHSPGAARLAKGELSKEEYARWCVALWCVYDALETALSEQSYNHVLSPTFHPALLSRASPLSSDISSLLSSPAWQSHPAASSLLSSPPTPLQAYVGRLTQLAQEQPERLLAHAYVRYLGDLSGGQIIRRRLAKQLSLSSLSASSGAKEDDAPTPGLTFFEFPRLDGQGRADTQEMRKIKDWFRRGMDEGVGEDEELKQQLVDEANEAFRLNAGLFGMLDEPWDSPTEEEPPEEVYSPLAKPKSSGAAESEASQGQGFPLTSFIAFLVAVGLAHFLLVTMGFTGQRGWEKFELVQGWVKGKLEL
ncbi:heme oxygenase-like protein [Calocera viscosa TUFC12733]|uniref:Heme oxygenase-like protein n=1 Tax=Calocera viscosa (strain TUFC12733) TaxID=1330018 RepID=A0A167IK27_CALVF|nr:heme oxygenase-like protein [Calocera viscosa TUFC12733]